MQWIKETRQPLLAAEDKPERDAYADERNGTANIFLCTEPLLGRHWGRVRARRTALDWATESRALLDGQYPEATRLRLVCAHPPPHGMGSL